MTSLENLTAAITALTAQVALVPQSGGTGDPGANAVQTQAAADAINAQTAILAGKAVASTIPAVPTGVANVTSPGVVVLTFPAVPGATSYNIKRGATTGTEATVAIVPAPADTTLPVTFTEPTALPVGVRVFYTVSAVNAAGESKDSAELTVTP